MKNLSVEDLRHLVKTLVSYKSENEWVEFKENFHTPEELGETISALSNGACLHNQQSAYLVFGVENKTFNIVGTSFKPKSEKIKTKSLKIGFASVLIHELI